MLQAFRQESGVSPRFGGGSGLKLREQKDALLAQVGRLPSLRRGEWIETERAEGLALGAGPHRTSPLASAGGVD